MTSLWAITLAASVSCYGLKLAGVSLPESLLNHPRVQRIAGLLPILWNHGTGSELMQRIAVPMIGGMVSSTVLTLLVIPAIYATVKGWQLPSAAAEATREQPAASPAE